MKILTTGDYDKWFRKLKDVQAKARINLALRRCQLEDRLVGDLQPVGEQVFEMRFHFGPGYRVYYSQHEQTVVLLLIGGDKSTQPHDIAKAKELAAQIREDQSWQ
ncbi:type II toxin-antitoxin system RelE/ParE family toxin [Austwickia chelonae]|uniref:type II toxin-antitoxin system RelE/ParE family toxin n=1 Tax=Austwickia chelonae TaxID=100225 RepID=UPI000E28434D|nr:type II toxin-antitoxin system RelE/ParE family toxin [Austwickia chelonae]